jgi:hypothetical protein
MTKETYPLMKKLMKLATSDKLQIYCISPFSNEDIKNRNSEYYIMSDDVKNKPSRYKLVGGRDGALELRIVCNDIIDTSIEGESLSNTNEIISICQSVKKSKDLKL